MPRNYFTGDPYWTNAAGPTSCSGCGDPIHEGDRIFLYKTGASFCKSCGQDESEEFEELAEAEYQETGYLPDEPDDPYNDDFYPDD